MYVLRARLFATALLFVRDAHGAVPAPLIQELAAACKQLLPLVHAALREHAWGSQGLSFPCANAQLTDRPTHSRPPQPPAANEPGYL